MNCPLCHKPAKTASGLRKHLQGQPAYGGHALGDDAWQEHVAAAVASAAGSGPIPTLPQKAPATVKAPASVPPVTADEEGAYLREVFERLVEFKRLPKYQFERRVDAFLVGFLPDLLGALLGGAVEPVVPEFPLKKAGSNLSTNVDHVFFRRQPDPSSSRWLLLELKTDMGSVDQTQIATYEHYAGLGMERLIHDVATIAGVSLKAAAYQRMLTYFKGYDLTRPIEIVYLSPQLVTGLPVGELFRNVTFAELEGLTVSRHPAAWAMFEAIVLPSLVQTQPL